MAIHLSKLSLIMLGCLLPFALAVGDEGSLNQTQVDLSTTATNVTTSASNDWHIDSGPYRYTFTKLNRNLGQGTDFGRVTLACNVALMDYMIAHNRDPDRRFETRHWACPGVPAGGPSPRTKGLILQGAVSPTPGNDEDEDDNEDDGPTGSNNNDTATLGALPDPRKGLTPQAVSYFLAGLNEGVTNFSPPGSPFAIPDFDFKIFRRNARGNLPLPGATPTVQGRWAYVEPGAANNITTAVPATS